MRDTAYPPEQRHLVDATMYWSPVGGGVSRYLRAKHAWIGHDGSVRAWRHSCLVPGPPRAADAGPLHYVPGLRLPASGGYRFPLNRRWAAQRLALLAPDLIESGDPFRLAWASLDAAQQRSVPAVAFCHGHLAAEAHRWLGQPGAAAAQRYLRRLLAGFDLVLAASRWMHAHLHELGLRNVALQPLGVDLSRFRPSLRDARWRQRLGIAPGMTVLLYAGRFAPEKNLRVLCDMVERLGNRYVLVALGAGPCPPSGPRVRVLPYERSTDGVARALASADVFVHAGDRETFGLAALEALACGTPVVVPDRGGLADLVDGRSAIGVASAPDGGGPTARAMADAVASLPLTDADTVRAAARQRAEAYDHARLFAQQFARYAALCQGLQAARADGRASR